MKKTRRTFTYPPTDPAFVDRLMASPYGRAVSIAASKDPVARKLRLQYYHENNLPLPPELLTENYEGP